MSLTCHLQSYLGSWKAKVVVIQEPNPIPDPTAAIKLIFLLQPRGCLALKQ